MRNRHPVDELADVREQIADLKSREAFLRAFIIEHKSWRGDEHIATLANTTRKSLDKGKLTSRFGKRAIDECTVTAPMQILRVKDLAVPTKLSVFD